MKVEKNLGERGGKAGPGRRGILTQGAPLAPQVWSEQPSLLSAEHHRPGVGGVDLC